MESTVDFDLEKYANDGWGLSRSAFQSLLGVMDQFSELSVIEFGSGVSTQFLLDYADFSGKNISVDSFDNDEKFKHPSASLSRLVHCNQKNYQEMFNAGEIDWELFKKRWRKPKTRQKNCFYDLSHYPLKDKYDLAVIDGPHGNGRNFAFLILKARMASGYILIDDFNHYDFLETASKLFTLEEITRVEAPKDNFVLVKVVGT